jgi:uncharacterized protein YukE
MRLGMDPDVVEAAGRKLRSQSQALTGTIRSVESMISQAGSHWWGNRAQRFVEEWRQVHRPTLERIAAEIDELGQSALSNAREQRDASRDQGGAPTSQPLGPSGGTHSASEEGTRGEFGAIDEDIEATLKKLGFTNTKRVLDFLDAAKGNSLAHSILEFRMMKELTGGLDIVGGLQDLNVLTDDGRTFEDRFFAGTDLVSRIIGNFGPVGKLGSLAIDIYSDGAKVAMNDIDWSREGFEMTANYVLGISPGDAHGGVDFSKQGVSDTLTYARTHPGAVVEETLKAIPQVPGVIGRAVGWPW